MRVYGPHPAIGGGRTRPHPRLLRDLPHWVYRLYDKTNTLLYVGCTYLEPRERIADLKNGNPTVGRAPIHYWCAEQYPNMVTALAAEGTWIDTANPPLNRMRSGVAARNELKVKPTPIATKAGNVSRRRVSA